MCHHGFIRVFKMHLKMLKTNKNHDSKILEVPDLGMTKVGTEVVQEMQAEIEFKMQINPNLFIKEISLHHFKKTLAEFIETIEKKDLSQIMKPQKFLPGSTKKFKIRDQS